MYCQSVVSDFDGAATLGWCISVNIETGSARLSFYHLPVFRRICHAAPAKGMLLVASGEAVIAPRYRCSKGLAHTAELRRKSVDGREQVSLFPCAVLAPDFANTSGLELSFVRSCSPASHLLDCRLGARSVPLTRRFSYRNTVYSVFK